MSLGLKLDPLEEDPVRIGHERGSISDPEAWNSLIDRSSHGSILHRWEALSLIAEHTQSSLHFLTGYHNRQLIGGLPIFERSFATTTMLFSPPPRHGLPPLGPCLSIDDLTLEHRVGVGEAFTNQCWRSLLETLTPSYIHLSLSRSFPVHPLTVRDDVSIKPRFTYILDLSVDQKRLFDSFSSDARRNVRNSDKYRFEIYEGGSSAIDRIVTHMQTRYEEQHLDYPVDRDFAIELYENLPDGTVRPYVLDVDGEFESGVIVLDDGRTVSRWQGGGKTGNAIPSSDILDWHIIQSAIDRDREYYDLVGANTPGICSYKAKFNPTLVSGYFVERSTEGMAVVRQLYEWFSNRGVL